MDTYILHVRRQSGITAAAVATKVIINGRSQGSIRVGGSLDFTLPRQSTNIVLLTQVSLGKDIEKALTIDPGDSGEVTLLFNYKFNAKSLLPFGAFTKQQSFIETEVIHGPSINRKAESTERSSFTEQPQQAAPKGTTKFCTECGTPNPKEAKFCQNCGNPFSSF